MQRVSYHLQTQPTTEAYWRDKLAQEGTGFGTEKSSAQNPSSAREYPCLQLLLFFYVEAVRCPTMSPEGRMKLFRLGSFASKVSIQCSRSSECWGPKAALFSLVVDARSRGVAIADPTSRRRDCILSSCAHHRLKFCLADSGWLINARAFTLDWQEQVGAPLHVSAEGHTQAVTAAGNAQSMLTSI